MRTTIRHIPGFPARTLAVAVFAALGTTMAGNSHAQQPSPENKSNQLDTVVVTAQKREQNVQEVPISVEAVDAAKLEKAGIKDLYNLTQISPSLSGGGEARTTNARVGIRGINDFARTVGFDGSVGVYVDGVYAGRQEGLSQSLVGVDRIEVLRGPQGTLFGKNTVAGAISMTTRKPTDKLEGSLGVDIGEFGTRNVGLWAGGALVPGKFQASIALEKRLTDGYVKNITAGVENTGGNVDSESARVFGRWIASKALTVDVALHNLDYKGVPIVGEAIAPHGAANLAPGPYTTATNLKGIETLKKTGGSITANYDLPNGMRVTSLTAHHDSRSHGELNDEDLTPLDGAEVTLQNTNTKQFSQELRVASAPNKQMDWLAGVFYMKQDNHILQAVKFGNDFPNPAGRGGTSTINAALDSTVIAAFAHGNYMIFPGLQFTGGIRWTRETKDVDHEQVSSPNALPFRSIPRYTGRQADSDVSPKVGLNWFAQKNVMLYVSYGTAFKSGGFNTDLNTSIRANAANDLKYLKEKVTTIEAGIKSELLDRRLRVNASVFQTKGTDYQLQQFLVTSVGTVASITNAAKVGIDGAELEVTAKLGGGFSANAALAYADATFEDYKNAAGVGVHFDGNKLPYAPRMKSSFGLDYARAIGDFTLRGNVNFTHTDAQFSNANNLAVNKMDRFDVYGARLTLEGGQRYPWAVSLWGKNLADKTYMVAKSVSFLGVNRAIYGAPRTLGVSVTVDF